MKQLATSTNLEGYLRDKVSQYLKSVPNLWYLKTYGNAVQRSGIPDFLICYHGLFVAIELKRPDGKGELSLQQQVELSKLEKSSACILVTNDLREIETMIENIKKTSVI